MTLTPTIERAIKRASLLHKGQSRKSEKDVPYITHLFSVAALLSTYVDKEDVIVAGLLHDTLEDTPYGEDELENEFGPEIKKIVLSVTEATYREKEKIMFSWKERKDRYLEKLRVAEAPALMVATADKIHNLQTIIDDFKKHGPSIWKNFNAGLEEQLWFFKAVLDIVEERLDSKIVPHFRRVFNKAEKLLNQKVS